MCIWVRHVWCAGTKIPGFDMGSYETWVLVTAGERQMHLQISCVPASSGQVVTKSCCSCGECGCSNLVFRMQKLHVLNVGLFMCSFVFLYAVLEFVVPVFLVWVPLFIIPKLR
jgi:hypothetical protein